MQQNRNAIEMQQKKARHLVRISPPLLAPKKRAGHFCRLTAAALLSNSLPQNWQVRRVACHWHHRICRTILKKQKTLSCACLLYLFWGGSQQITNIHYVVQAVNEQKKGKRQTPTLLWKLSVQQQTVQTKLREGNIFRTLNVPRNFTILCSSSNSSKTSMGNYMQGAQTKTFGCHAMHLSLWCCPQCWTPDSCSAYHYTVCHQVRCWAGVALCPHLAWILAQSWAGTCCGRAASSPHLLQQPATPGPENAKDKTSGPQVTAIIVGGGQWLTYLRERFTLDSQVQFRLPWVDQ